MPVYGKVGPPPVMPVMPADGSGIRMIKVKIAFDAAAFQAGMKRLAKTAKMSARQMRQAAKAAKKAGGEE